MIYEILEKLAANNSRNYKIDVLNENKDSDLLKRVIFLALDPFTQFYIRKIPKYTKSDGPTLDFGYALDELSKLSKRELTGNAGIEHLTKLLSSLEPNEAKVIERIIGKDLKCGASTATVNAVWSNLIKEYPCMLCSKFEQKTVDKIKYPALVQLKLDGMRFNAIVKGDTVEFRSRNGRELIIPDPDFPISFLKLRDHYGVDMVFDGELVVMDSDNYQYLDRQTGNGILSKSIKGTMSAAEATYVRAALWDAITFEAFQNGIEKEPYNVRLAKLTNGISHVKNVHAQLRRVIDPVWSKKVDSYEEAEDIFKQLLSDGQEGIILKDLSGIWEDKRVKHQIKMKGELDCDLQIVGYEEGTGKYVGKLGALLCSSNSSDSKPLTVKVGSGFNDDDRSVLWSIRDDLIGKVVAIKYNARIVNKAGEHSLFLPIFLEVREDKDIADSEAKIV